MSPDPAAPPRSPTLPALLAAALLLAACGDNLAAGVDAAPADGGLVTVPLDPGQITTTLDPYGVTPLAALVTVRGVDPAAVRRVAIAVDGLDGENLEVTLPYDTDYATRYACPDLLGDEVAVQVPVLGLYADLGNQVRIALFEDSVVRTASLTIQTDPLPAALPEVEIVTADRPLMEPGWNLAVFMTGSFGYLATPFIYDAHGRIRWVLMAFRPVAPGFLSPMTPLRNGNLVLGCNGTVYEYSLLGREVNHWLLPEGFSQTHDVYEMPDGNLLVCGNQASATVVTGAGDTMGDSDQVAEIDRVSGGLRNLWDLRQFLDVDRYVFVETGDGRDWFHINSVIYVPEDDTIIVSGRHQGVVALTRGGVNLADPTANKQLLWILAPHSGWGRAGPDGSGVELAPYLLAAVDDAGTSLPDATQQGTESSAAFGWPFGQHSVMKLRDGSVFMFDNGLERDLGTYTGGRFSRAVAYEVTPDSSGVGGTVRQVWDYGRDRPELYGPIVGGVGEGAITGDRIFAPGSFPPRLGTSVGGAFSLVEVRPDDERVVFEARIYTHVSNFDIIYRDVRVPLYRP